MKAFLTRLGILGALAYHLLWLFAGVSLLGAGCTHKGEDVPGSLLFCGILVAIEIITYLAIGTPLIVYVSHKLEKL